jgi:hypothetical protein
MKIAQFRKLVHTIHNTNDTVHVSDAGMVPEMLSAWKLSGTPPCGCGIVALSADDNLNGL